MKVWKVDLSGEYYSGGMVIVAANTREEAIELAAGGSDGYKQGDLYISNVELIVGSRSTGKPRVLASYEAVE